MVKGIFKWYLSANSLNVGLVNHLSWKFRQLTNFGKIQGFFCLIEHFCYSTIFHPYVAFGYHRLVNFLTRTNILKHFYRS